MARGKKKRKVNKRNAAPPNLKSASGAGFSFEDKVAASLFCEMLLGKSSLGGKLGVTERIERQAPDWEPFGDLLLTVVNNEGKEAKCGCSVKSNRQVNTNGCSAELRDAFWTVVTRQSFNKDIDSVGLFCSELASDVSPSLHQLCRQAKEEERPKRLDEKILDQKHRKIYDSFRHSTDKTEAGLPWHVLFRLIPREFDFEKSISRSEEASISHCREVLHPADAGNCRPRDLWKELLDIARDMRDVGGSVTRESLISRLRGKFRLKDDPSDIAAWNAIRSLSREWISQVDTTLPGNVRVPRSKELGELRTTLEMSRALHVIGESGAGKSALLKIFAADNRTGSQPEVVWVKAEQFPRMLTAVTDFVAVLRRSRATSALLVFDAMDSCYSDEVLDTIGRTINSLLSGDVLNWKVVLVCQTQEWSRVSRRLVKTIAGHDALSKRVHCGELSPEDKLVVFEALAALRHLASQPRLARILSSPKMLDLLLRGQIQDNLTLAGEADVVEWWWDDQVKGRKSFADEEKVARSVATRMGLELTTEVSPDVANGSAEAVDTLIKRHVLRRTRDGRLRFDHDLLADWSRVMHLRAMGDEAIAFMRANTENPPWIRAIRLLSQHLLERAPDMTRWQSVLRACNTTKEGKAPPAEDLQVLDAWIEGIAFCADAPRVFKSLGAELFANDGWLLQRFVRRLLHTGTIPDPVVQKRIEILDPKAAEDVAVFCRLPQLTPWQAMVEFLTTHSQEVTELLPVEIAEIGAMWARLEEYLNLPWPELANLVVLNAEKELRREVAGEYRHVRGARTLGGGHKLRANIYATALQAATQIPDRVAKFALKAAGRAPWDEGDLSADADGEWSGVWDDRGDGRYGLYVKLPIESWPDGPSRSISRDFFHAWFDGAASVCLYQIRPELACEVSLALLIEWPKKEVMTGHHSAGVDRYGFQFEADRMYPAFWSKGPFLPYLRHNWRPALQMILQLTNFATDRYQDWWPYEPPVEKIIFDTPYGKVQWRGNDQVYAWNRYHMNTPQIVTCALMALEKWFDEQMQAKASTADSVEMIYRNGSSLALAGVLVSIGKRHLEQFSSNLKPLLFVRKIYMHDIRTVLADFGGGYSLRQGEVTRKLRREWNQLPGRKKSLKEACYEWVVTKPELQTTFDEVCAAWRKQAEALPDKSEDKMGVLRWAAELDRSLRREITLDDGQKGWRFEMPVELRDDEGEQALLRQRDLLHMPHACSQLLTKRPQLSDEQLEAIWQKLQNWTQYEQVSVTASHDDEFASSMHDHRQARSALLAVVLCLGESWLDQHPSRRAEVENEVRKLLDNPPKVIAFTDGDIHDDFEGFLARCAVRCWAVAAKNPEWRGTVGEFVTAHRYRTVWHLFDEAFRVKPRLGDGYLELEALALSFAVARHEATKLLFLRSRREVDEDAVMKLRENVIPKFAACCGPTWEADWSKIEDLDKFPPKNDAGSGLGTARYEFHRRDYGSDMGVIFASFGHLPELNRANGDIERAHWFNVCRQMLGVFLRTLPSSEPEAADWHYDHWSADEKVFEVVARRLFECSKDERRILWEPIVKLGPAAHHHITEFLNAVLLEAIRTEPPRISDLIAIWGEMAENLADSDLWTVKPRQDVYDVWKTILLYGTPFTCTNEPIFAPVVEMLRPFFERYAKSLVGDAHEQSSLVAFFVGNAGEQLLVNALTWLAPSWETASSYFWNTAVERGNFERLLDYAWREKRIDVRGNKDAFKAFKILTLSLATRHVPIALAIQQQIGTEN